METLSTPSHLLLSPGLLSPLSLSPLSLSSHSPHLLSPGCVSPSPSEPGMHLITSPPLSPVQQNPRLMHLRSPQPGARRPLVKQYSMDLGGEGGLQQQQRHGSVPSLWDDKEHDDKRRADFKPRDAASREAISQSHPTLPKADSLDSDPGHKTPHQRFKQRLLRSRSSGAKYSRFRDKYKREMHGEDNPMACAMLDSAGPRARDRLRGAQCGSVDTASDMEDSLISHWAEEEAACDEEVMMITGEAPDDEDDVRPTLVTCTSSDDSASASLSSSAAPPDSRHSSVDCEVLGYSASQPPPSLPRGYGHGPGQAISPLAKSPCPSRRGGSRKARHHLKDPGIDNSSFDLGEEVQTPKSDSVGSSKSGTPASLKGRSPCNTSTPQVPAGGGVDSVSPASVRQVTSGCSLPSPATPQAYLLTPLRSPAPAFPGHLHVPPVTPTFPLGSFLQVPVLCQGLPSPQSPVPGAMRDRHIGSPPIQRLPVCPPSPVPPVLRPQSLVVPVERDGHYHHHHHPALSDPRAAYPLSPSPLPPAAHSRTEPSAGSAETALPLLPRSPSTLPPQTHGEGAAGGGTSAVSHPLQPSPIPPTAGPPPSPLPPRAGAQTSPKVRHRTLSSRQSLDRDCPDKTGPR
ncbi:hypothetical protein ACOMHN_060397 [Nucella lapillus]